MKEMKRILALVLCLVMLVGIMPASAFATETGDAQTDITAPTDSAVETTPVETTEAPEETEEETTGSTEETEKKATESSGETEEKATESSGETEEEATESSEETEEETTEETEEETTEATESDVIAVTGITLDQTELEVGVGAEPVTLIATVLPEDATDKTVTWTSSEPGVAAVEDGILSFGYMGEAVITATAGDFSATCTVTVGEGEAVTYDDGTIYILAGGDFQEAGDHANSAANVTNILAQISQKYETMDGFLFIGDYDCETHNSATETANGITALMGAVQGQYSNLNYDNSVLVQGNHDYMDSHIDSTGGHDFAGYAAYVLNEDDYPNNGGSQTQIQNLANNMKTWLNNKIGEGYSNPIFIVSHLPLAFTPRTVTQGDAKYAKYIFDVLNDAGKNGLNIIFMHGHDHAYGPDNYMGGEAIYLPEGDKICIAEAGSTSAWTEETLNFTYMNAGYTGYYSDAYTYVTTAGTDKLTMTVFAITGNQVTVERYSEDGLYNLKSAGYDGSYSNTSVTNVSLGLPKYSAVYASPQYITLAESNVDEMGSIGEWVGVESTTVDDVKPTGSDWTTITRPVEGTTTYAYTLATSITRNGKYVIVANDDAVALMDNNGDMGDQTVTITGNDGSQTMTSTTELTEWTFSNTTYGTVYNGTRYLRYNWGFSLSNSSSTLTFTYNDSNFRIRSGNYSFYYNGSSWTRSGRNTAEYVRLFVRNEAGDTTVGGKNGLYAYLDGEPSYTATAGMTADQALAMVQNGVDAYYYEGMSDPDSNVTGTKADDSVLTWTLDPAYNANTPGDYAVTISYNGTTLGTAEVVVPNTTTYYRAEGNELYLVDMNTTADNAMAAVKAGVTVYSATDANGSDKTAVSDDLVTWKWLDTYNGADSGPYTVEILYNGTSLGTVEVKVNVQYDTGIETDWTYIGESEATGGSHTYTLDTDGIDYGEEHKYIIVDDNEAIVLNATSSSNGTAHSITISGNTATTTTRDYEYHVLDGFTHEGNAYHKITKGDGSQYLYQEGNGVRYGGRDSVKFQVNHHGSGVYDIHDIDGTNWYIIYNGGWTVTKTTSARVRLYKYTSTTGGTPGGPIYALIEGPTVYNVTQGSSSTKAMAAVKAGITGYIASDANGTGKTELADSDLTWKWKNTFNGNSANSSYWVEISYQGKVLGTVQVNVVPGVVNNYPEYPNEGAVKVNKTGTGIDFQSSGIAQVEVSASGIPLKKGIDVIIMVDTSSSMRSWCVVHNKQREGTGGCGCGLENSRATVFENSLDNLIAQLQARGDDNEPLDIRVALADFNGFNGYNNSSSYGSPYDREENDTTNDTAWYSATNQAKVYTGTGDLTDGAFVPATELPTKSAEFGFKYVSGTNYDYAFDAVYQLGHAIKKSNTEERDLYVVFMSDGAPMQYNYYHSQGASNVWQYWLTGTVEENGGFSTVVRCQDHIHYYDEANGNKHRMAEAIKGSPDSPFEVIRKSTAGLTDVLKATGEENMYTLPGLGATMFSIAFDPVADGNTPASAMTHVLEHIASEQTDTTKYYFLADSEDDLASAFTSIGATIAYAAYNARFVDQMGDDYNLQMKTAEYTVVNGTTTTDKTLKPKIEIIQYDIYTRQDYLNGTITEDKIGDRKGTYKILETVTFNADGTEAYSDQIGGGTTNILAPKGVVETPTDWVDGVIYAKTFLYNTNILEVAVDGVKIPTGETAGHLTTGSTNVLPSETFYWKMGTVQTSELAMRYYVYLEGSMEGTKEGGSYPTNEYATLYYDNYLGKPCYKETVSPVLAWKEANVSYAFYLVDKNGNIVVNQTTGQTGSFANKIAVTNPVVYETVLLNSDEEVSSIDIASLGVLPEGYTLYDYDGTNGATYTVKINSNTTGEWEITSVKDVATTYVMQYDPDDPSAYSNALTNNTVGDDYTHTIVWFAVLWEVQALPDVVVVDYGLPVDIHVLTNDMFGENGTLAGIGAYSEDLNLDSHDTTMATGFGNDFKGRFGNATIDAKNGTVEYKLESMQMDSYEKFAYAVNYTGNENAGYYYDTITVIPATTIYYEDSFLTFNKYKADKTPDGTWGYEGDLVEDAHQDEDRPGQYSLTDANNIYGYDAVNLGMSTFSLGQARVVHVDANSYATAEFTFKGTGFDVIGMTSNTTGTIAVEVKQGETVKARKFVNTYYGYTYENGEWIAIPDVDNALYQVPVLQIESLPYGEYTVTITATYASALDKTSGEDGYDLYLDAIRIYDPANDGAADGTTDTTIEDAYKDDGEGWPSYIELRNKIIPGNTFGVKVDVNGDGTITEDNDENKDGVISDEEKSPDMIVTGLVFIDGDASVDDIQISDYISYGPNNEVYLAPGQRVAFLLNAPANTENIHIGIKSADGQNGTYTITNIARNANTEAGVKAGDYYGARTYTINTTTDMYYDLTGWKNDIIVISNTGNRYGTEGIISLTNIKATYTSNPNAAVVTNEEDINLVDGEEVLPENEVSVFMTPRAATLTLRALNKMSSEGKQPEEEETQPEETKPEETKPEETKPEETKPEETKPEETKPEETQPEETQPEETQPEETQPEETQPEETQPEETQPEENEGGIMGWLKRIINTVMNWLSNLFR